MLNPKQRCMRYDSRNNRLDSFGGASCTSRCCCILCWITINVRSFCYMLEYMAKVAPNHWMDYPYVPSFPRSF